MVDFKKRLAGGHAQAITEPLALYDSLDRASDKGPLRPAQIAVLSEWHRSRRDHRDVIVKLHTGQGKTLVGLLILQSRLNSTHAPAIYICPNNFLISQTCLQAKQFGIPVCTTESDGEIPTEFLSSRSILVTSVQKVFNGLTKFGLRRGGISVATLLMDDAHACSDSIRDACKVRIPKEDPAYSSLVSLFAEDLEHQGVGTYADILNDKYEALLPVPYWAWVAREQEVAEILSAGAARKPIRFAWPIVKDMLRHCQCVVSGGALEIEPRIAPLEAFGTYWKAQHRVFMSATVTDDAFLVKGLQLAPATIANPLTFEEERWSGEKMILIPAIVHDDLHREEVVHLFSKLQHNFGIVVLVPSFAATKDWETYGAEVATTTSVEQAVTRLRDGVYSPVLVLVNRYDGIDLPDDTCRILVFDGKPHSESLIDLYHESCRPHSDATLMKTVRTIEQGMGRSVRGEKDYSVIVVLGTDITRLVRDRSSLKYLSPQMRTQIELGLEVAELAAEDIRGGATPQDALTALVRQSLQRDPDWKAFYVEKMNSVKPAGASEQLLRAYESELAAESLFLAGDYASAAATLQRCLDSNALNRDDAAWYLQEMARYQYSAMRQESQHKQVAAHAKNHLLLRPPEGVTVTRLTLLSQNRMERLIAWVQNHDTYESLNTTISDILARLTIGTKADRFEQALDELGRALGFASERPDKEWKEGPDNLWALDDTTYVLWECKSEVEPTRPHINKREAEQMNRSCAWFQKHYPGAHVRNIIVHPAYKVESAANFISDVQATCAAQLRALTKNVRAFFKSFEQLNFRDLSSAALQELVNAHDLSVAALLTEYTKVLKHL